MDRDYINCISGSVYPRESITPDCVFEEEFSEDKDNLRYEMLNSAALYRKSKRNGVRQSFLFSGTKSPYKYNIVALPYEKLYGGDIIDYENEKWLVTELEVGNKYQISGVMWLCNLKLRFQNGTSKIIEVPAVLDSGVYSTTKTGDDQVQEVGKQFKLYLPYNEDTKKIFVDKRLAIDVRYDSRGDEILEVYQVTGINRIARSYGTGSHLLICELKSGLYSPQNDSIAEMICDYIDEEAPPEPQTPTKVKIIGQSTARLGTVKKYSAEFYNESGVVQCTPVWSMLPELFDYEVKDGEVIMQIPYSESLIGSQIHIEVEAQEDSSIKNEKYVEVL